MYSGGPWLTSPEHNDPDHNVQQPLIVADVTSGTYHLTGAYYAMSHFSKYIPIGSRRIQASHSHGVSQRVSSVAFHDHESGTVVVVLMNDDTHAAHFTIALHDYFVSVSMPPISFTTLQFSMSLGKASSRNH